MAKNLWYDKIDRNVDWGGDESTNNLPVAGSSVQEFIKSELNDKIGIIYHDEVSSRYLCFANEDDRDAYIFDPTRVELIKSSLPAPVSNTAEILMISNHYNAILLGSTGNYLEFGFSIKNSAGQDQVDNIDYNIVITKNANVYNINGSCIYGKTAKINLDEYLINEGTTSVTLTIKGQSTHAEISTMITYDVVNLSLKNDFDVSTIYDLEAGDSVIINYSIFGSSNIKYVEWYVDGIYYGLDTLTGGTVEALAVTKYFSIKDYVSGVHNIQFRAYVDINGEKFYTDTLYREFIVVDKNINDVVISFETEVPKSYGIVDEPKIYNASQYEPCTFYYGVYNKKNLESVSVDIYIDNELKQTVNASNGRELGYTFVSEKSGVRVVKMVSGSYEKTFEVLVSKTDMNINEVLDNLELSLDARGRSNSDANKESWVYGDYTTKFSGFTWSETSGWNNNRLIIGEGMSIETSIKPFKDNTYGKALEIEFETINVVDDDAIICDVRNDNGVGLLLTASEASLRVGTAQDQVVSTKFKSGENIRICFVINNETKMVLIYINGIVSGAIKYGNTNFSVDKELNFSGSSDAGIQLKQVLVYGTKLNSDQILNNYILYRDSIDEMRKLYDRNDILDGALFSIEKISQSIPVMMITGDVAWLETQKDTDAQTGVDVEYINYDDPTRNFKMVGGCLRIQGTSSAGYPKKNYRLYTKRKTYSAKVYDYKGNIVESQKLSFKEGAAPVNCWCLKADYAESSGTHNTGVATIWNDVMKGANDSTEGYVCRTMAQKAAIENNYKYDVRTTVDGFPIVVFARQSADEEYVFIGKYNFNNDKSTEDVFGFCDIPGFDDSKMQCWEMTENGNNYALFKTTEGWDDQALDAEGKPKYDDDNIPIKNWASGFEARYPDDGNEADTTDLKAFADWLISCDAEKFAKEKSDHIDLWKTAAYYIYLMRFGAVDQVVKNSMFTSEDGQHWYYINYDNDTVLGLKNTGALTYPPTITRNTVDGNTYAYAGRESRLWNMLENDDEFMRYVSRVDTLLYNAGLTYDQAIKYFNGNQSDKWCERIYNKDAEYKYITPSTTISDSGLEVNTLFMMQGSRKAHRTWWLAKRFKLMDGKFNNSNYVNQNIMIKLNGSPGLNIDIVAGEYMYYGCESNSVAIQMGVELNKGERYTFYKAPATEPNGKDFAVGDPIYIYAPYAIEELDLSKVAQYLEEITLTVKDPILGTRLKKLTMSSLENQSQNVNFVAGLSNATNLEYLDVRGLQIGSLDLSSLTLLKTLLTSNSGLVTLELPDGCAIEHLQLGDKLEEIKLTNLSNLTFDNIEGLDNHHISRINIRNTPALTDKFSFYYEWANEAKKDDELTLTGLHWTDISPDNLLEFKKVKDVGGKLNLKGKIEISQPTIEQVEELQDLFGEDCFTNNAELWIFAPESVFIHGPKEMRSGDSQLFTTTIFSESPGTVEWQIESGEEWVESIISNTDNTGVLTTIEDEKANHVIVVKAIHKPANSSSDSYYRIATFEILSKKVIYSTGGKILGNATIKRDTVFNLSLLPNDYNGDYSTIWEFTGESFANGNVALSKETKDSVTVKYLKEVIFEACSLIAHVTNKNGTKHDVILPVTITDDSVLMTSTSNPEVMSICYSKGWAKNPNVMYKTEAQVVTDIGDAFKGGSVDGVYRPGHYIKTFNELEEFKNIITIPEQAFFQCGNLTEITLPINIQSIGSFALGSTNLKSIRIPNNVTNIYYTAFDGSPIESFEIGGANVSYKVKDGILISSDGILVKYPEGKMDTEYTTDESIVGLGQWSIKGTKLRVLNIGDNVVSHNDRSISDNVYLNTINFGSSIAPNRLALNISGNNVLMDINVSNNHISLCSVNGVVYDISKNTLWKYPEGRSELSIESTTTKIGSYAMAQCMQFKSDLIIPDHIEVIEENGLYASQNITGIIFNETSKLHTLGVRSLQLLSRATIGIFPASLKLIQDNALGSCWLMGNITFNGSEAPALANNTVFGTEFSSWTGKNATSRVVYVPSNAMGYDSDKWNNSIFSEERKYTDSNGVTTSYKYLLSKTL